LYGLYDLFWEVNINTPIHAFRKTLLLDLVTSVYNTAIGKSGTWADLQKKIKVQLGRLAIFTSTEEHKMPYIILGHYIPKVVMMYFIMEDQLRAPKDLTLLPNLYSK
jgi:hypothetical protein